MSRFLWGHLFEGDREYCQKWLDSAPVGNPETTGVFTMKIQCSYPRDCHPESSPEVLDLIERMQAHMDRGYFKEEEIIP